MRMRFAVSAVIILALAALVRPSRARSDPYTVNGSPVAPEMAALLQHLGLAAGAYYVDPHGNYGRSGGPPMGNLNGGPVRGWSGLEPRSVDGNPYAQAYVNGVAGLRVFYVYSPSAFSGIRGGASGHYHICPGNVYYQEHEGAVSAGGRAWVGSAQQSRVAGRWTIENGRSGPVLALHSSQGGVQRVAIATLLQGKFEYNRVKYVVEPGRAVC